MLLIKSNFRINDGIEDRVEKEREKEEEKSISRVSELLRFCGVEENLGELGRLFLGIYNVE